MSCKVMGSRPAVPASAGRTDSGCSVLCTILILAVAQFLAAPISLAVDRPLSAFSVSDSVNGTTPGPIEIAATQLGINVKWWIEGDDDLDCQVAVAFRRFGSAEPWRDAQSLLRVEPAGVSGQSVDPGNLLAGSLLHVEPGTSYEIRLILSDPDGGAAEEIVSASTRTWPAAPADARVRYVTPGSGGGTGTEEDPFQGLAAANAQAEPGDLFLLAPGIYDPVVCQYSARQNWLNATLL